MATTVSYVSGGKVISAELLNAKGKARGAAIIIAHGSDGMTDNLNGPWAKMIRAYADDLSNRGFVALIPKYFEKTGTKPGLAVLEEIEARVVEWQSTVWDAVAYARTLPGIDGSRIGLLGFSLGGNLCLRLRQGAKVLVTYFAPLLNGIGSAPASTVHAQIHHGLADRLVPFQNGKAIDSLLRSEGAKSELFSYPGAVHGFLGKDASNVKARLDSKSRTISCFDDNL